MLFFYITYYVTEFTEIAMFLRSVFSHSKYKNLLSTGRELPSGPYNTTGNARLLALLLILLLLLQVPFATYRGMRGVSDIIVVASPAY